MPNHSTLTPRSTWSLLDTVQRLNLVRSKARVACVCLHPFAMWSALHHSAPTTMANQQATSSHSSSSASADIVRSPTNRDIETSGSFKAVQYIESSFILCYRPSPLRAPSCIDGKHSRPLQGHSGHWCSAPGTTSHRCSPCGNPSSDLMLGSLHKHDRGCSLVLSRVQALAHNTH